MVLTSFISIHLSNNLKTAGRFLRKDRLEKRPKHVSESCVVVFGTETIIENDGRMIENPVALKFMSTREMFYNEMYQRREVE